LKRLLPLLALLVLAGCGGSGGGTTTGATTSEVSTVTPTDAMEEVPLDLYFLHAGELTPVHRVVQTFKSPASAAIEQLAAGPTAAEHAAGLVSAIPSRFGFQVRVSAHAADVSLSATLNHAALGQLTYTLTGIGSIRRVTLAGKTYSAADFERLAPAILITSPTRGQSVNSPFRVTGTANTFEATFTLELRTGGRVLTHKTVHASSGSGTRGAFDATLRYPLRSASQAELRAYELSQQNGQPVNEVSVPISLLP
jgi:Immunoglobulin-like domain of bacterial spore germination/Sporulation and spore germination